VGNGKVRSHILEHRTPGTGGKVGKCWIDAPRAWGTIACAWYPEEGPWQTFKLLALICSGKANNFENLAHASSIENGRIAL